MNNTAHPIRNEAITIGALLAITAVWGSSFVIIHGMVEHIPPFDLLGIRFSIAAIAAALIWHRQLLRATRLTWHRGITLGLFFAAAQLLQTYGLAYTSASISGFISGMYVVLTPLLLVVLTRVRISALSWLSFIIATIGMAFLTIADSAADVTLNFGWGEALTLGGAMLYALHIILLGRWSQPDTQQQLTAIQMITLGIAFLTLAAPNGIVTPSGAWEWTQMFYMALVSGLLAIAIQTWAQSRISPTKTAIILTGEPVWGAFFAVLVGGEVLTWQMILGGTLIVAAMLMAELLPILSAKRGQNGTLVDDVSGLHIPSHTSTSTHSPENTLEREA